MVSIDTPGPWYRATFLHRPNRFIVHARLDDSGQEVRTHLPDPGRLLELLVPGATLWLKPADRPRRTAWSTIYVRSAAGDLVCCDTRRPNQLVAAAVAAGALDELDGWRLIRAEAPRGASRFDFLLGRGAETLLVEVKGVSWVEGRTARFPDAVTARGARHLTELAGVARSGGYGAVLFMMQRSAEVDSIEAAADRDPLFAEALDEARSAGVGVFGRSARVTLERTTLGPPLPVR